MWNWVYYLHVAYSTKVQIIKGIILHPSLYFPMCKISFPVTHHFLLFTWISFFPLLFTWISFFPSVIHFKHCHVFIILIILVERFHFKVVTCRRDQTILPGLVLPSTSPEIVRSNNWIASWETQQCGCWTGPTQTGLYSYRSRLEAWNFGVK